VDYYRRGLALAEAPPADEPPAEWQAERAAQLNEGLGDVLTLTGEYDEATQAYQSALDQVPTADRIWRARLHRKNGTVLRNLRQYDEALQTYERSLTELGNEPPAEEVDWWRERVQIDLERVLVHYHKAELSGMVALVDEAQPMVERHGTPVQRSAFFEWLAGMHMRRDRYVPSEDTFALLQAALAAAEESGSLDRIADATSAVGLCHLLHGDLENADEWLRAASLLAERIGDVLIEARCLMYLAISCRKRGQVAETRQYASRCMSLGTGAEAFLYATAAKANLAWVAWREGDLSEAHQCASSVLAQLPPPVPFRWVALWPLIAVALAQEEIAEAVEHAQALLDPMQQRLPDALATVLGQAIETWDAGEPEAARTHLKEAVELAQDMGCF